MNLIYFLYSCLASVALLVLLILKLHVLRKGVLLSAALTGVVSAVAVNSILWPRFTEGISVCIMLSCVLALFVFSLLILVMFFRDPDRPVKTSQGTVLCPADGTVRYVKKIQKGTVVFSEKKGRTHEITEITHTKELAGGAFLVGIEMSIFDVHVNRAPVDAEIAEIYPSPGKFLSLRTIASVLENERVTTIWRNDSMSIGVIQIASRVVRRIKIYKQKGDRLKAGQRFGRITFGSQVDVVLPECSGMRVLVKPGQFVQAGVTHLAVFAEKAQEHS